MAAPLVENNQVAYDNRKLMVAGAGPCHNLSLQARADMRTKGAYTSPHPPSSSHVPHIVRPASEATIIQPFCSTAMFSNLPHLARNHHETMQAPNAVVKSQSPQHGSLWSEAVVVLKELVVLILPPPSEGWYGG